MPTMHTMTATKQHRRKPASFEQAALDVLQDVRSAFAELIVQIPRPISKAFDLQKALDVDPKLASRVFRVAHADDPLRVGTDVPSRVSIERIFKAAAKEGVPAKVIQRASIAYEQFERLVADHAGDRESFASMVSALSAVQGEDSSIDAQQRKAAYLANSHILGVQARTRLNCFIHKPAYVGRKGEVVGLRGLIDLRWLRTSHAPFTISRSDVRDSRGDVDKRYEVRKREPLDPDEPEDHGVALLREFCSRPLPKIETVRMSNGMMNTQIVSKHVGKASLTTCIIGEILRDFPECDFTDPDDHFDQSVLVRTPCEVLIQDVLLHEGPHGELKPQVRVLSDHQCTDGTILGRDSDMLPLTATVKYLGKGPEVMHTRDVPRYADMVQYAMDRLGWDGSKFEVYRCRIEYPVMPSTVSMRLR